MQNHQRKRAPEVKADTSNSHEVAVAFDEFMEAFEAFRETNNQRLNQLENQTGTDVVVTQKMDRINAAMDAQKRTIDQLLLKSKRPSIDGGFVTSTAHHEHKNAFEKYVRKGDESGLRTYEEKAMSYGTDADGGYLVPEQTADEIGRRLAVISPIRSIAGIRNVSASIYKKPFALSGPAVGWVAETDARPQTATPALAELQFPTMELYAMPAATPGLLEDSAVDLDAWLAEEVDTAFAEQEGTAFVTGDGTNKPRGFLDYTAVDESSWSWGNLGYIATGSDGAFDATNPADTLVDAIYALKAGYRQNGSWVMNRKTQAQIRKLKDGDGNYFWQPPAVAGGQAQLLGFPVVESEDMPDIGTDSMSISFGDFSRGYLVVDRTGVRVLRDPYSAKPYILFYTTKRVGGGVQDFNAIKLVKFGTA